MGFHHMLQVALLVKRRDHLICGENMVQGLSSLVMAWESAYLYSWWRGKWLEIVLLYLRSFMLLNILFGKLKSRAEIEQVKRL